MLDLHEDECGSPYLGLYPLCVFISNKPNLYCPSLRAACKNYYSRNYLMCKSCSISSQLLLFFLTSSNTDLQNLIYGQLFPASMPDEGLSCSLSHWPNRIKTFTFWIQCEKQTSSCVNFCQVNYENANHYWNAVFYVAFILFISKCVAFWRCRWLILHRFSL